MTQRIEAAEPKTVDEFQIGQIRFEEVRGPAGCSMPWHDHPATYIDLYIEGATDASWHSDVGAHTVSILPAGVKHRSTTLTEFHTFQIVVAESWLDRLKELSPLHPAPSVFDSSRPAQIGARMFRCFSKRDGLAALDLESLLFDFWAAACPSLQPTRETRRCAWLRRSEEMIRAHYAESLSPDRIASEAGIHPAHLMREFRRVHRCSIGDYVRSLRIEQACGLLNSSSPSFAEIAHAVGFADQSHFNRSFKAQLGVTPSGYVEAISVRRDRTRS